MQTRSLETLVRIYEVQSFSKAAELRGMTLSALSMQMKSLELELDAELFDRTFRPPKLTPLGRMVAERAQSLIREERALVGLCGASSPLSGVFQVGFVQSASVRILPSFVKLATGQAPKARFRFSSGLSEVLEEQVASGQIDCAVITRVGQPEQLLRYDLIASEVMSIAAPADCEGLSDVALSNKLPFIHFRPSTGIGKLIASFFENSQPSPFPPLVLDGIEACMECVKAGLGYTILPRPDINRYADKHVAIIEVDTRPISRDLVLVSRRSEPNPQWVEALCKLLVKAS
ncbi:MAG: LysR family transcriptional regulator [Roseibium sp.]|uniref:LysR family transcriptional regulator n=1 Tax=Roseibium sp. TaxID=1936156 RepID=UPI002611CC01|nr:LysR family transcriptional regulator [Roseibium sp.]MCV0429884.1 LysR family transcriptional regulator [Roseibium sp.]